MENQIARKVSRKPAPAMETPAPGFVVRRPDNVVSLVEICDKITNVSLYLLTFLLPLFFLPWTANALDFNKQALLLVLGFVALAGWLAKGLLVGKVECDTGVFNIFPAIFLLAMSLATIFSLSRYGSFWGWPLHTSENLISLIFLTIVYFLVINTFQKDKIFYILLLFVFSGFLAMVYGTFQLFGKFFLPFDFSQAVSFNTVGSPNNLALLSAILLPLTAILLFISKKIVRLFMLLAIIVSLIVLIAVHYDIAWWLVGIGSVLLITAATVKKEFFPSGWLFLPMLFLVFALLFGIFKFQLPGFPTMPIEVSLSQNVGLDISAKILKGRPLLGGGPGTFVYSWAQYKPSVINNSAFWNLRFGNSSSKALDIVAGAGILGLLTFLAMSLMFLWRSAKQLEISFVSGQTMGTSGQGKDVFWTLKFGLLASFAVLLVGSFLRPSVLTFDFMFFLFMAGFMTLTSQKKKEFSFEGTSLKTLVIAFVFIAVFALGIGVFIVETQRYVANIQYVSGIRAWQAGDSAKTLSLLEKAVSLNARTDMYWRDISQIYLAEFARQSQNKALSQTEAANTMQQLFNTTIASAAQASKIEPNNVLNWSNLAFIYQSFSGAAQGAEDEAARIYDEAVKREPQNPYYPTQKGITMLRKAILLTKEQAGEKDGIISLAQDEFNKAISLKNDYAPAHFQIAMIYQLQGRISEAIKKLEETKSIAPADVGVAFQLGLLYYQNKDYGKAAGEFERAVAVSPNYSNALYFLGLAYDQLGRKTAAITQLQKVADLNPDNNDVKKILSNLQNGKSALAGIGEQVPPTAPIEEKPAESSKTKKTKATP